MAVSKPIIDGDLVKAHGINLLTNHTRVPIMTGVAYREWAHKKALFYGQFQDLQIKI